MRDNLLTPQDRSKGIFAWADEHDCGVLINKPLSQGLLTGCYTPRATREFGDGDHRSRKRWFTSEAIAVINEGLDEVRDMVGASAADLVRVALWSCLLRSPRAAVLVGFSGPDQVMANLTCVGLQPSTWVIESAREIMGKIQQRLDADGEVFVDEATGART